ncbi:ThuA domain-containing protein [Paenibacillus sp. FJAT-26967]|uniref:ThuA domain-containing protein n=1 Tax=Paenibacillus sp. FJAT-26967 TaxID=1729690 RepID=UPI0008397254|nr:ThuA domain-containing protein [Paenibacillus sp. FJAT-26967]
MINVTVWNENVHEKNNPKVAEVYPQGIHGALASGLAEDSFEIRTATLDQPEHGLTQEVLDSTDVLIWWGHKAHGDVSDAIVDRVQKRVLEGMGLVVLHSGHFSKIFKKLMGTSCDLRWREDGEKERLWVVDPAHPIAQGVGHFIELEHEEMYGEHFDIPAPDELVFVSWFEGGEVFRSGCTFHRGQGRIFYFRPGHETYPTYYNKDVLKVISNGVKWAAPVNTTRPVYGKSEPLEIIKGSQS